MLSKLSKLQVAIDYRYAFSFKRMFNFLKVVSSMAISRLTGMNIVWGYPLMLMIEPTNICNLKCPLCPSGNGGLTRARGTMGLDEFKGIVDEMADYLILLMLWNQGEPFINREFTEMIRYAKSKAIPTITSTNGHFLRKAQDAEDVVKSGLDEIIVSLDGATPESYAIYRKGGDFNRVIQGVKNLCQSKRRLKSRTPIINLQFIVMRHNENEIESIKEIAEGLQVDKLAIKTAQVYTQDEAEEFLPEDQQYRRYVTDEGTLRTKSKIINFCNHIWYSCVINWNGDVSACCFDKDVDYPMGSVLGDTSFKDLWRAENYRAFRDQILKDRAAIPMCSNCTEGLKGIFHSIESVTSPKTYV